MRDDKIFPSSSEVCYEGQMSYLRVKNAKRTKGALMLFVIWLLAESELEPRLSGLIHGPLNSGSPLKLFFPPCRRNLLYGGNLCGCRRQLIYRGGWNKDKGEHDIEEHGWRILHFMSHIQFLGLQRCLELLESLPYVF